MKLFEGEVETRLQYPKILSPFCCPHVPAIVVSLGEQEQVSSPAPISSALFLFSAVGRNCVRKGWLPSPIAQQLQCQHVEVPCFPFRFFRETLL